MRRLPNIDSSSQPFIGGPSPSTFDDDKTIMGMVMIYVDGDDKKFMVMMVCILVFGCDCDRSEEEAMDDGAAGQPSHK